MSTLFQHAFEPTVEEVRGARGRLAEALADCGVSPNRSAEVQLAFAELANNLVQHGEGISEISVQVHEDDSGRREFRLLDNGQATTVLDDVPSAPEPGSVSGMGLFIAFSKLPDLAYEAGPEHNQVRATIVASPSLPVALVVDDDPVMLIQIEDALEDRWRVVTHSSAEAADEWLQSARCDLIICDVHLPDLSGPDFRARLLQRAETATLPFVLISGDENVPLDPALSDFPIDGLITKPLRPIELANTADRVLARSQQLQQAHGERIDAAITEHLRSPLEVPEGWQVGSFSLQARGGGDVQLSFRQPDGAVLIVIGDVMGHDEAAAFFRHSISGLLYGLAGAHRDGIGPADFLALASDALAELPLFRHTSVTLLVLRVAADGNIECAAAGHPPPELQHTSGAWQTIPVTGRLPGTQVPTEYRAARFNVTRGERIALYTDGLCAPDSSAPFELEDLRGALSEATPADLQAAILAAVPEKSLRDDASCVLLSYER